MKELILGGARSGKSHYAEMCAKESELEVLYLATAQALDDEMKKRIEHHQQQRPSDWRLVEEPLNLTSVLKKHANASTCILVDCLTLWLSNLLCADNKNIQDNIDELITTLPKLDGHIIFVSNEVSMGVIPMGEMSRQFVDETGRLHQRLAKNCNKVTLMVAGIPSQIKG